MNSDARVMEFFPSCLSRVESDALVDRIQEHFSEHDFGSWAIEVADVAPFVGFGGLAISQLIARFRTLIESVGVWRSSIGEAVMQPRLPGWPLPSHSQRSYLSRLRAATAREQSWSGLGYAAILLRILTILRCRKIIRSERMYFALCAAHHYDAIRSPAYRGVPGLGGHPRRSPRGSPTTLRRRMGSSPQFGIGSTRSFSRSIPTGQTLTGGRLSRSSRPTARPRTRSTAPSC